MRLKKNGPRLFRPRNPRNPRLNSHRMIIIGALALFASAFAQAPQATDDTLVTANGNAVIHPIGHASVQLTWNGKKILIDPAPNGGGGGGGGGGRGGGRGAGGGRGGGGGAAPAPSPEALAVFTS